MFAGKKDTLESGLAAVNDPSYYGSHKEYCQKLQQF